MNATAPTSRIRYAAERQEAIVDAAHTQGAWTSRRSRSGSASPPKP